ncbi:alpha/beta hydrolase [Mycolicibacterium sp.]|uniref:alpha/beta hydrolase n=1 Tax=Mycolicibacterium sp. TaxID=2320850 RepID=UPI0037C7506D
MPFLDGDCGPFYYRHWDTEAPRAQVLLLHGFGEHTGHYHRLAGQLTAVGLDVWGPDHIGHGHTGGSAGMFASVDDLASNAAVLLGVMSAARLPVAIVGHSLGAVTGALLAIEKPCAAVSLVMTGAPLWGQPEVDEHDLVMSTDEAYLDALEHDPLGFDTAAAEPNLWHALDTAGYDVRQELPALDLPVLMINGEHDVFAPPRKAAEFAAELRRGRAVAIRGGHHDIPNDVAHRQVAALIAEACLSVARG